MDLAPVTRLVAGRGAIAQLCVIRDGEVAYDGAWGVDPDTPLVLFSAGKPLTSMLVHRLAGQGLFALDDPISRHWPEFGARQGRDHHPARSPASLRSPVRENARS
nr:serine hydrolase domain-containing protein [Actinoplanes globisporus]